MSRKFQSKKGLIFLLNKRKKNIHASILKRKSRILGKDHSRNLYHYLLRMRNIRNKP